MTNCVQRLTITGNPNNGSFKLGLDGILSGAITYVPWAAVIQTTLEAMPNIGAGNITVTDAGPKNWDVEFKNDLGNKPVSNMSAASSLVPSGSASVSVMITTQGEEEDLIKPPMINEDPKDAAIVAAYQLLSYVNKGQIGGWPQSIHNLRSTLRMLGPLYDEIMGV